MRLLILAMLALGLLWTLGILWWASRTERTKVVERQIVVRRCGFCSELRPVEATRCDHCGAQG